MKRLTYFLAAALVALVLPLSRAEDEHDKKDVIKLEKMPPLLSVKAAVAEQPLSVSVADRCDMGKIKVNAEAHNRRMAELWRAKIPKSNLENPELIIFPPEATSRKWSYLCQTHPASIWALIEKQGKRVEFNEARSIDDQVKLIGEAVKQWKEVDVKVAGIRTKANEIAVKSKEYVDSVGTTKRESGLSAVRQKELLAGLIKANGEKLLGAEAGHAPAKGWATGGELFDGKEGLYTLMKELATHPLIAAGVPAGAKQRLEGKQDLEGQGFNRQMMRVLWRPKGSVNPDNLTASALDSLDSELGKDLNDNFYTARKALNDMNQAVIHQYGPQPGALGRAVAILEGRVSQEKLAALERERRIRDVENNVARKTAEQIFDRSGRSRGDIKVDEMDSMVNTVRGKMASGDKAITFTSKGKDDKSATKDMPMPVDGSDPKIIEEAKGVAELLMQDKDVQANLAAAGLALKGDPERDSAPDDEVKEPGQTGDLAANLKTPKDEVDNMRDLARQGGPGCTKNSVENLKASENDKIGDLAKNRINDRVSALKELNKSEAEADKALKAAELAADRSYAACKSKLDKRKESRTIRPADYEKGLAACAGTRNGEKAGALGEFNKTMSKANSDYKEKVVKAGSEKQISKWEKESNGKLDGVVVEIYNREINDNRGALVSKYGSESGRVELGRAYAGKKGQFSEDVPEEFVADYLKSRWGNPPAALKDTREYLAKKNLESEPGMDRFVKEVDFPVWYDARKADIGKDWDGSAKKEPAKKEPVAPGDRVKKIDPKAVDEELDK